MPNPIELQFLAHHSPLKSLLADGEIHAVHARIDESFLNVTFRSPHAHNNLDTISTEHLTSRLYQNIANAVQQYQPDKWYRTQILGTQNGIDTSEKMQRSNRQDQPTVGASETAMLDQFSPIPQSVLRQIVQIAQVLRLQSPTRSQHSIVSEIASIVTLPEGARIPRQRLEDLFALTDLEADLAVPQAQRALAPHAPYPATHEARARLREAYRTPISAERSTQRQAARVASEAIARQAQRH